jgi:hypothetical protein
MSLGFGPSGMTLAATPALMVDRGEIHMWLSRRTEAPVLHPNLKLEISVWRVDWRGRPVELLKESHRRVRAIGGEKRLEERFRLPRRPGVYRLTATFQTRTARTLGTAGFYTRLVRPTLDARLRLDASTYARGHVVLARFENLGTTTLMYGAAYRIERFDGGNWVSVPEAPTEFPAIAYFAAPGASGGHCSSFLIPHSLQPGRYRMSKEVRFEWRPSLKQVKARESLRTAEFEISP